MTSSTDNPNPSSAELNIQLAKKQQMYQKLIRLFYVLLVVCAVVFAAGLCWWNAMAIAGGSVSAMMLGMAYLCVVIARDDELKILREQLHQRSINNH